MAKVSLTFGSLLLISQKLRQAEEAQNLATTATSTSNCSQNLSVDNFSNWHFSAMIAAQHAAIKANRIMLLAIANNSNNSKLQANYCCGSNKDGGHVNGQWQTAAKILGFRQKVAA